MIDWILGFVHMVPRPNLVRLPITVSLPGFLQLMSINYENISSVQVAHGVLQCANLYL